MRGSRLATVCALAGLLLLAVVVARGTSAVPTAPRDIGIEWQAPTRTDTGADVDTPEPPADMAQFTDEPDQARTGSLVIVLVLILLAVLIMLAGVVRNRRRTRVWAGIVDTDEGLDTSLPTRLRDAVARAGAGLAASERAGGPPGDAVVAAWLTLEQAAAREGTGRAPHQTPTEFTAVLLGEYTSDETALAELRGLYQRARFGTAPLTDDDVRRAREALDRVLAPV